MGARFTKRTVWQRVLNANAATNHNPVGPVGPRRKLSRRELYSVYRQSVADEERARGHSLPSGKRRKPAKVTRKPVMTAKRRPTGLTSPRTARARANRDARFAAAGAKKAAALKAAKALVREAQREAAQKKRDAERAKAKKIREAEAAKK